MEQRCRHPLNEVKNLFSLRLEQLKILSCVQETRTRNERAKEETKIKNDKNMELARAEAVAISCDSVMLN